MIKDKLIQILQTECDNFGVSDQGYDEGFIHHVMFNVNKYLRCDKCRHWDDYGPNVPGFCLHDDGMVNPRADDFCSRWEAK